MGGVPLSKSATIQALAARLAAVEAALAAGGGGGGGGGGITGITINGTFGTTFTLTKSSVGLGLADNTADVNKSVASAARLTTARSINGVPFDGTQDITIGGSGGGSGITALTGDVTASGTGSVAATLATVNNTVGTFGSATAVPVITVNGKGLVTSVTTAALGTAAAKDAGPAAGNVPLLGAGGGFMATDLVARIGTGGSLQAGAGSSTQSGFISFLMPDGSQHASLGYSTATQPFYLANTKGTGFLFSGGTAVFAASAAAAASVNLPHGSAPTNPNNGDMWTTTAGLYVRVQGVTVGPLAAGGSALREQTFSLSNNNGGTVFYVTYRATYAHTVTLTADRLFQSTGNIRYGLIAANNAEKVAETSLNVGSSVSISLANGDKLYMLGNGSDNYLIGHVKQNP